jgi:plastocyanin
VINEPVARRSTASALLLLLISIGLAHADITGTVTLIGKPNSQDETFFAKANGCGESPVRHTENWKVGPKGELGDVVVWVVDPKFQPVTVNPFIPIEVDLKQLGCRYLPHVAVVEAGVNFTITNADPTLHNIRANECDSTDKPLGPVMFNFGQATQGQTDEREFDTPGIYSLQCDVHSWMQCWVMVVPKMVFPLHGVTGPDGKFSLPNPGGYLIDGDYKIEAWHPRFDQTLEQTIHVKNGTAQADFQFDGTKSF